jgi:hypothetical protein
MVVVANVDKVEKSLLEVPNSDENASQTLVKALSRHYRSIECANSC